MKTLLYVLIFSLVGCATANDRELTLEKQLRQATKERDQAREDYEADVLQAFHRTELDHRFPYSGMPRVPDWVSPVVPKAPESDDQLLGKALDEYCSSGHDCHPVPNGGN